MLENQSMIYFAPERWSGLWRNRQQLMSIFSRENNVLFVEPRPLLRAVLAGIDRDDMSQPHHSDAVLRRVSDKLAVFRFPMWAPLSGRYPLTVLGAGIRRHLNPRTMDSSRLARLIRTKSWTEPLKRNPPP